MKTITIALLMLLSGSVLADDYVKPNGGLTFNQGEYEAEFSINASLGGDAVCNLEGIALAVDPNQTQRSRWVFEDAGSQCQAVISEHKDGSVKVTTKDCEGYCGMSAVGAMDGKYLKQ